ncbi:MAG: DUF5132 domain-containing protein [Candidatus Thiodiazotropha sp.]|jgi:hypothetical protein
MALIDELVKNDIAKGVALGAGLALAVPALVATLWPVMRPVARSAIKAGLIAYEKGREGIAELSEEFEDLIAETQEELRADRMANENGSVVESAPSPSDEAKGTEPETRPSDAEVVSTQSGNAEAPNKGAL